MVGTIGATLMIALTLDARPADAQLTKAGVVVGLEGDAKVQRLGAPAPAPLQFRDDVFVRDRATTGENSRARFLLGGKAVLTMRERSVVTITETPSSSTVDIASGRFALAVAKERLKPGEVIEIRTPNAVAGIRGTVVIAEVFQASAQAGGPPAAGFSTRFLVVRGVVEVTAIDPATGRPTGNPVTLDQNDAVTVTGSGIGAPQAEAPGQVQQLASIYSAPLNVGIGTAAVNDAQTEDHKKLWRHDRSNKRERIRDLDPGERGRGPDKDRDVPDNFRPSFGNPDKRNNPLNPIGGVPGNAAPGGPGKSGGNGGGGNSNGGGGGSSGSSGGGGATGVISGGVISGASSGPGNSGGHGRGRGPNH
jgi:uncharacterized membrane protein YgcG